MGRKPSLARVSGLAVALLGLAGAPPAAMAGTLDCHKLATSTVPYEIQVRQADSSSYPIQVYRGENLTRLQYTKAGTHLITSRFQANFHLEVQDLAGTDVRFTYDVPTNRYIWQQDRQSVRYRASLSGAEPGPEISQDYEMLADDVIVLAGCSFSVKHFRFKQNSSGGDMEEDVWFSPDLQANLRLTATTKAANGTITTRNLEATTITTEFASFR